MALQLGALREALVEARASNEKSQRAAEELAAYENRLGSIDVKLERLEGKISLVQSLLGIVIAGIAALVLKAFAWPQGQKVVVGMRPSIRMKNPAHPGDPVRREIIEANRHPMVSVTILESAKPALYGAMVAQRSSSSELARCLGIDEKAVRRLRDLLHGLKIEAIEAMLRHLGLRAEASHQAAA